MSKKKDEAYEAARQAVADAVSGLDSADAVEVLEMVEDWVEAQQEAIKADMRRGVKKGNGANNG